MEVGERAMQILIDHGVECVTEGKNAQAGNFSIPCPWCGDDPSQHLGVRLDKGWYNCWRSPTHHGRDVEDVLVAVLGWSREQARIELGREKDPLFDKENDLDSLSELFSLDKPTPTLYARDLDPQDGIADAYKVGIIKRPVRKRKSQTKAVVEIERKTLLKNIPGIYRPIKPKGITRSFWKYLSQRRGFGKDTAAVITRYDLWACLGGEHNGRVVIPYIKNQQWVTFTGRSISDNATLRYLALRASLSLVNPRHAIWNYDTIREGGRVLVITEGPLDAMKVDYYGWELGVRGTCVGTVTASSQQANQLQEISTGFEDVVVVLDRGFELQALELATNIGPRVRASRFRAARSKKDFGDLNEAGIRRLLSILIQEKA